MTELDFGLLKQRKEAFETSFLCFSAEGQGFFLAKASSTITNPRVRTLIQKKGSQKTSFSSGRTGIRTLETLLTFTHFPGVPLQPLEHPSQFASAKIVLFGFISLIYYDFFEIIRDSICV